MAQFELNIYGNDDELLKTFATDHIRWGVFTQAVKVLDDLKEKSVVEQFQVVSDFIKKIFPDLTDADLEKADCDDVFNTFYQLTNKARTIGGNSKNAERAAN